MSNTAAWSYTNTAKVKRLIGLDRWKGVAEYDEPYTIDCTWTAAATEERGAGGQSGAMGSEFVSKYEIYTEDPRPKHLDLILLNGDDEETGWQEIRSVTHFDMSSFGEDPDYKLVT